jgi:deoxyribodipyrimidine photo-lyase
MAHRENKRKVIWLKRDFRLSDHRPLAGAADGECLVLYIAEPSVREGADFDDCHDAFIRQSLSELQPRLQQLGGRLVCVEGEAVAVFDRLYETWPFDTLSSHQETGNDLTYQRDRAVAAWTRRRSVHWQEFPQHGVFRGLSQRDGWAARWRRRMDEPITPAPERLTSPSLPLEFELPMDWLNPPAHPARQPGGERVGQRLLQEFLDSRGQEYATRMSSPVTAHEACSRLSPYLSWGNLSMREIYQTTEHRAAELRASKPRPPHWLKSLAAFSKRLRWHCHFIQKLEDQPSIEFENMHRACDGLRESAFDETLFEAWKAAQTGYPMVDACMRALKEHKWINFRMRAMLVSFASYHLWLDWRRTAPWLARHFLDYEPGIHYSQFQMQSGTIGINTLRIYSPAKQVLDQDPEGRFIHRWCPELSPLTGAELANPESLDGTAQTARGFRIGRDYPKPIVDHVKSTRAARSRILAVRRTEQAREESRAVLEKHGSRKQTPRRTSKKS